MISLLVNYNIPSAITKVIFNNQFFLHSIRSSRCKSVYDMIKCFYISDLQPRQISC